MVTYTKCVGCGHQQAFEGNFNQAPCTKCGCNKADVSMGAKPDWWKS